MRRRRRGNRRNNALNQSDEPPAKKANIEQPESPVAAYDPNNHDAVPSRQELENYYGNMRFNQLKAEWEEKVYQKGWKSSFNG